MSDAFFGDTATQPSGGTRWLKFSVKHKIYLLPDGRHTMEVLIHGGFFHLTIAVRDKFGNRWARMEQKFDQRLHDTQRKVLAARMLAAQVYGNPHKPFDEFEKSIDEMPDRKLVEALFNNSHKGGTI